MGARPHAILAYGYDLGGPGAEWKVRESGEYGELALAWFDNDGEDGFVQAAERRLLAAVGFTEIWTRLADGYYDREREAKERLGAKFESYISLEDPQYILAAHAISVDWDDDAKVLDLTALQREPADHGWDAKLQAALDTLGLTPKQEQPGWLLVPYEA